MDWNSGRIVNISVTSSHKCVIMIYKMFVCISFQLLRFWIYIRSMSKFIMQVIHCHNPELNLKWFFYYKKKKTRKHGFYLFKTFNFHPHLETFIIATIQGRAKPDLLKGGILGSRIPDIIRCESGHICWKHINGLIFSQIMKINVTNPPILKAIDNIRA